MISALGLEKGSQTQMSQRLANMIYVALNDVEARTIGIDFQICLQQASSHRLTHNHHSTKMHRSLGETRLIIQRTQFEVEVRRSW